MWLFCYFNFERSYYILKSKVSMYFIEQKHKTLIKTKQNLKLKIPHTVLEKWTLCFSSYKNQKLKVKLMSCKLVLFCLKRIFWRFVLSQCKVYWTLSEYTYFTYQKHYFVHFCCLFLKSLKAFIVSLKIIYFCRLWFRQCL